MATFQGIQEHDFLQRYTRLSSDRRGLSLHEKPNGECVFLAGHECSVQPAKPQQCRDFPNLWNFPGFQETCRAIPKRVGVEEYKRLIQAATGKILSVLPASAREEEAEQTGRADEPT